MKSYSKPGDKNLSRSIPISLTIIFGVGLLLAISIVCFFAPTIDAYGEWISKSIVNRVYTFVIALTVVFVVLLYFRFKK